MDWSDIILPLITALLAYFAAQRSHRIEREKILAEVEVRKLELEQQEDEASKQALVEVSGGAVQVVSLLRDEVKRLSTELSTATREMHRLRDKLQASETENAALLTLIEANGRRNEEISLSLDRALSEINMLKADLDTFKKTNRDLLRQNGILVTVAEKTLTN